MISCLDISNRAIGNALFNYYFLLTVSEKTVYKIIISEHVNSIITFILFDMLM